MRIGFYLMTAKGYEVLKALIDNGHNERIAYVCVGKDNNIRDDFSESIHTLCTNHEIVTFERDESPENKISCAYKIAVSWRWLIESSGVKLIVLHDSLLPRLRGFSPLVTALINQDKFVGVTAIIAENEYDRGPIIQQKRIEISYPVKIAQVIKMISPLYCEIVLEIMDTIMKGHALNAIPQDEALATYSIWRDDSDYRINWDMPASSILAKINASGHPYSGASTILGNQVVRISEASLVPDVEIENRDYGKVIFMDKGKPVVVCRTGLLKLEHVIFENGESALPFQNFRTRLKS